jgi:hypothetical protein
LFSLHIVLDTYFGCGKLSLSDIAFNHPDRGVNMKYKYNDGGRQAAGYKGAAGDCGARAIAIALGMDYKAAYSLLAQANKDMGFAKSARNGIHKNIYDAALNKLGWTWVSAPKFQGRKAKCSDMPSGIVIARQAGHFVAVDNGIPQDTWDSSEKMVYGYWVKA